MPDTKEELQYGLEAEIYKGYLETLTKEELIVKIICDRGSGGKDEDFKDWKGDVKDYKYGY